MQRQALRVLVVEDDPDLRAVILEVLEEAGHVAVGVGDVPAARGRLGGADVVLLDLHLPGEPAEGLLAELRPAGVEVVLTSADASSRARVVAERWSAPLVVKPFDLDDLLRTIEGARAR